LLKDMSPGTCLGVGHGLGQSVCKVVRKTIWLHLRPLSSRHLQLPRGVHKPGPASRMSWRGRLGSCHRTTLTRRCRSSWRATRGCTPAARTW
jgi:hypothetical protein